MQYYKDVIAELKKANIIPMVTLYHWDLPQHLQEVGGWLNESIVDHFNAYANKAFSELGDDVSINFDKVLHVILLLPSFSCTIVNYSR